MCVDNSRHSSIHGLKWLLLGLGAIWMSAPLADGAEPPRENLIVRGSALHHLTTHHLLPHAAILQHLSLVDVPELRGFEPGCLTQLTQLKSLYIWKAPLLKKLPHDLLRPAPPLLRTLRIINCGLEKLPDLSSLADNGHLLHIVDFESNQLKKLHTRGIRVRTNQLLLDSNLIEEIENYAFEGSEFDELSLKGNSRLKILHDLSFAGIIGIRELDLSGSAITHLPAAGLGTIEVLRAQNIITMKTISSIHYFKNLKEARLTHHFHCCAFQYPERHDPKKHEVYLAHLKHLKKLCSRKNEEMLAAKRNKRNPTFKIKNNDSTTSTTTTTTDSSDLSYLDPRNFEDIWNEFKPESNENNIDDDLDPDHEFGDDDDEGIFHQTPVPTPAENDINFICDNFTENAEGWAKVRCWPKADALNPCEDVLGGIAARTLGWITGLAATIGNMAVAAVLITRPLSPSRLLLLLLAIADLGTSLSLLLIAVVDTYTADNYFNYAYDWQYGPGCKIAGFLAIWGAQGSLSALAALTLERWLAITRALLPQSRLSPRSARLIVLASVVYSVIVASAPLYGGSHFSSTSICLPMRHQNWADTVYLCCLLSGGLFCLMAVIGCYVHIYMTLAKDTPRCSNISGDARVANKMAILIATHMACCVPVAVVGFGALIDHPILGVHGAKLLLVLIYPLNALADPFLYAILTHQFRRDLYLLLDRYGLCSRRAQQYKVPGVIGRERRSPTGNSMQTRRVDRSLTTGYEDLLV